MRNLYFIEEDNRLFITILSITLFVYLAFSATLILLKSNITHFAVTKKNPERLAKLIMNLPVPVYKAAKRVAIPVQEKIERNIEKKVVREVKLHEEKSIQSMRKVAVEKIAKVNRQIDKKIRHLNGKESISKNISKKELVQPEKKNQVVSKNIENLGMLNLISAIGDPDVELADIQGVKEFSVEKHNISTHTRQTRSAVFDKELLTIDEDRKELNIKKSLEKSIISKEDKIIGSSNRIVANSKKIKSDRNEPNTLPNKNQPDNMRDVAKIESVVSGYASGMKFCYNKLLRKEESVRGNIVVKFTILGSGNTKDVSILENEIKDKRLESCIIGVIGRWEFPPSGMEQLVVTYPLKFIKNS